MSYEEKGTWVYLLASVGGYAAYLAIILGRTGATPLADVSYAAVLLWTIGASIAASIVGRVLVETVSPSESHRGDVRDREILRAGDSAGRWFVLAAAGAALFMAMARWDRFWIANVIYLGFVLSAVGGSTVRLVAYRRGL